MGLGFNDFTAGNVLTAAQVDGYLMRQTIMVFASTSARDTALSGNLEEGMFAFTTDTDSVYYYDGAAWQPWDTPWTTFTPSWTGITVGNGTSAGRYRYRGGDMEVRASFTLGSTSSITASVQLTIPNSETSLNDFRSLGLAYAGDDSTGLNHQGSSLVPANDTLISLYAGDDNITASNPFTFTTSDVILVDHRVPLRA